jgi:hypothetical protein
METIDASRCPLCGRDNQCAACTPEGPSPSCWCVGVEIPPALLDRVPGPYRDRACVCRECVERFAAGRPLLALPELREGDYYMDDGLMVFTAAFHRRRGYCCHNGCRHCPYP